MRRFIEIGDVCGLHVAVFERLDLVLHPAKVEEQLFLGGGGADLDEAPRAQDELLDRGTDPPHGIGSEAETAIGLELFHALHQADIALRNKFGNGQAVAAIAHGDLGNESQVRIDQFGRRISVAMFAPAFGKHELFLGSEDRELLDFTKISVETGIAPRSGDRQYTLRLSHSSLPGRRHASAPAVDLLYDKAAE
jgi:hypothetical protein